MCKKKWRDSATYKSQNTLRLWRRSLHQLCRRDTKFGTYIPLIRTNKKYYYGHAPWLTVWPPSWIEISKPPSQHFCSCQTLTSSSYGVSPTVLKIVVHHLDKWGIKMYPQKVSSVQRSTCSAAPNLTDNFWNFTICKIAPISAYQHRFASNLNQLLHFLPWTVSLCKNWIWHNSAPYRLKYNFTWGA